MYLAFQTVLIELVTYMNGTILMKFGSLYPQTKSSKCHYVKCSSIWKRYFKCLKPLKPYKAGYRIVNIFWISIYSHLTHSLETILYQIVQVYIAFQTVPRLVAYMNGKILMKFGPYSTSK